MYAVEAHGLQKHYRRAFGRTITALRGVDLRIPRGVAFGLIGLNGAGKTTFIKSLLSVVRPTEGTVQVLGASPEDASVRARVGYLPERSYFPPSMDALAYLGSIAGLKRLRLERAVLAQSLERVGLAGVGRQRVSSFSKGMKQRLGLASALLGAPELLLLDEPTDGIDPLGRMEVRTILDEERRRGATILLNSHLLAETERFCDRVAILHGGRVLIEGSVEELLRAGESWRARFAAPAPAEALGALGFEAAGEAWRVHAPDPAALNRALDGARAAGALLVELGKDADDLEGLLSRLVRSEPS